MTNSRRNLKQCILTESGREKFTNILKKCYANGYNPGQLKDDTGLDTKTIQKIIDQINKRQSLKPVLLRNLENFFERLKGSSG